MKPMQPTGKIFLGLDIGSTTTKSLALSPTGEVLASAIRPTGALALKSAEAVLEQIGAEIGLPLLDGAVPIYATGYGRDLPSFARARPTEIACVARAVHALLPGVETVIDVGGQDTKVVRIGPSGRHVDFSMNDRCAAGTGRFLEVMARVLELPLDRIGPVSLTSSSPVTINSMCTVFAESEVVSLIARGSATEDILAGIHAAVASRIAGQAERFGLQGEVALAGGGALNEGLAHFLGQALGRPVRRVEDPQLAVAHGAALLARDRENQSA